MRISRIAELPLEARTLLARASVIAEAPGVSFIPSGRHEHDTKAPTTGTGMPLYDRMLHRFLTTNDMDTAIRWAEAELHSTSHSAPPPRLTFKQRILIRWEGHSCEAVAQAEGIHRTTIWRWRREAKLDPADGTELERNSA